MHSQISVLGMYSFVLKNCLRMAPGAEKSRRLIFVINYISLSAFVGLYINNNVNGKLIFQPGTPNGSDHVGKGGVKDREILQ